MLTSHVAPNTGKIITTNDVFERGENRLQNGISYFVFRLRQSLWSGEVDEGGFNHSDVFFFYLTEFLNFLNF